MLLDCFIALKTHHFSSFFGFGFTYRLQVLFYKTLSFQLIHAYRVSEPGVSQGEWHTVEAFRKVQKGTLSLFALVSKVLGTQYLGPAWERNKRICN